MGTWLMLDENYPVIAVAPSSGVLGEMRSAMAQIVERGAELLVISDDEAALAGGRLALRLPVALSEWLSPLVSVIPGHLLALHMVLERGHDPDRPRGLEKVTLTR